MTTRRHTISSVVEQRFLRHDAIGFLPRSIERIPVVVVDNYVRLGQLTALRFLEWVAANPEGVVALPTGKTPEYFIRWIGYYRENWSRERDGILRETGFRSAQPPSCKGLRFVQIDEFFPIRPDHERAFSRYVSRYYIDGLGIDPSRAMLIDTFSLPEPIRNRYRVAVTGVEEAFAGEAIDFTLRFRQAQNEREALQQDIIRHFDAFCQEYESKIRHMGGIGFFLGGIGPDGHVAFNVRGSSHYSVTRLTTLNYESMAAGAQDLGGIETIRKKAVITVGLQTITFNPAAVAIIFAAGEAKASVLARAIEQEPSIDAPATALQVLPNARCYLTRGAASQLTARRLRGIAELPRTQHGRQLERLAVDSALRESAKLRSTDWRPAPALKANQGWRLAVNLAGTGDRELARRVCDSLIGKLKRGLDIPHNQRFLHTGPHHDDIELAYFPLVHHLVRSPQNINDFCYLTSGFTSVTNDYVLKRLVDMKESVSSGRLQAQLSHHELRDPSLRSREIHGYLNAIAARNPDMQNLFASARLCRNLLARRTYRTLAELGRHIETLAATVAKLYPGALDPEPVQQIKSWIREWEAETVWAHFGLGVDSVHHLRLRFYTGEVFTDDPQFARDVVPIVKLLEKTRPTIVTLALDPEGSGPDTHYKCLMALRAALKNYVERHRVENLLVWGYRNVWSRFHAADADMIVPVSLNSFAVLDSMFRSCFVSQKAASFPSFELDGTFSELAQKVWVEQFGELTSLLGKSLFYEDEHPMMRRAYGVIYLKEMTYGEFMDYTAGLEELERSKRGLA